MSEFLTALSGWIPGIVFVIVGYVFLRYIFYPILKNREVEE